MFDHYSEKYLISAAERDLATIKREECAEKNNFAEILRVFCRAVVPQQKERGENLSDLDRETYGTSLKAESHLRMKIKILPFPEET